MDQPTRTVSPRFVRPTLMAALPRPRGAQWTGIITAGATLAALMIPLNIGYAEVAGLPPTVGLYAAIVPMIAYAIFATSRHVIASPDAAIAALMASLLAGINVSGDPAYSVELAYALAILSGLVFFMFWLFRLGFLANYLSKAVLVGMVTGLGIEVLFSQIRKIMGVTVEAEGFFREAAATIAAIPESNWYSVAVGVGSFAIVRLFKRYAPRIPGALVALVIMTVLVAVFNLDELGVSVLGPVPAGLPSLTFPAISPRDWVALLPGALAIVALTLSEGLLLARKYAEQYDYKINPDQEEFAYGAANVVSGFTGGFAVGASASRSAAMDDAGAQNQWPSVIAAVVVAIVLLFFTDLLALLPKAALAGIVASAVLSLIEIGEFRELYRKRRSEFWIALVCTVAVLGLGTLPGIGIAFVLTTVEVVRRAAAPRTSTLTLREDGHDFHPQSVGGKPSTLPGGIVYRFGGPLFFANAPVLGQDLEQILTENPALKWFILDAEAITDIDSTGADALEGLIETLHTRGVALAISRANDPLPALLETYELLSMEGAPALFETNREAVAALHSVEQATAAAAGLATLDSA